MTSSTPSGQRNDGAWLAGLWVGLSVVGCLLVYFVWGPHLPPGAQSSSASSQQFDIKVLAVIATPVVIGVLLYFGWALAFWRQRPGDVPDAQADEPRPGIGLAEGGDPLGDVGEEVARLELEVVIVDACQGPLLSCDLDGARRRQADSSRNGRPALGPRASRAVDGRLW